MKRLAVLFFILFLAFPVRALAGDEFLVSSDVTYEISSEGDTKITHRISLTNASTEIQATDYTLSLKGALPKDVTAKENDQPLETSLLIDGDTALIKVFFREPVVGVDATRNFEVSYQDNSIVKRTGEVKEINIPRLISDQVYESYLVKVAVPKAFGTANYISPQPDNELSTEDSVTYYFGKSKVQAVGVTAAFGEFQVFSFDLTYHLQNPLAIPSKMEIALPPDTSFQRVSYESLNPKPDNVYKDADGNWLANYNLGARERMDVRTIGSVQIFSSPWKKDTISEDQRKTNLAESQFWQTNDEGIRKLSSELKSPKAIFDYVVETLDYNYENVSQGVQRKGAIEALKNPKDAICLEFTDLFITLARAAGIPAREVNGFAYTDNATLKPLSLVADVLHSWPEYWDVENSVWKAVDPTWSDTTGGIDYFTKLDMRHVNFVMHGASPTNPIPPGSYKLGANPQKDIFVSFGQLNTAETKPQITISQKSTLPFSGVTLIVKVSNPGPKALYDQNIGLFFDSSLKFEHRLDMVLPFEERWLEFTVPYGIFGNRMPDAAKIVVGTEEYSYIPDKRPAVYRDLIALTVVSLVVFIMIFLVMKGIRNEKHKRK